MSTYSSSEVKSGFLILFTLVLLIALSIKVGGLSSGKTKTWQVEFGYLGGLEDNAPVYFAGREAGKVKEIVVRSEKEKPMLVTIQLDEKIQLRNGTKATIDTLGLMGEKFIEILPGPGIERPMEISELIPGQDPVPMHQMVEKLSLLADRMDEMTASLNPMLKDLQQSVSGHQEEAGRIVANLEQITANLRDMTHELKFKPWKLLRKG